MSCHGNPWLSTPAIDALARESVRFENYHVEPVCTPTRASLMTGRYASRVGAWAVTEGRQLLQKEELTMAEVFANSGYRTAMFGKWHLGDTWPYAPRYRGFEQVVRHLAGGIDEIGNPFHNDYFDDTYYRNGAKTQIDGYCTDIFFQECQNFIATDSSKPFFVYLPLNAMHGPHTVDEKYSAPFLAQGHDEVRSKFFGQIINFDENLSRLLKFLDESDLRENTIVIFMSDNGTAVGAIDAKHLKGFNAAMRGKKGSVFEGGHRVACFARWPNRFEGGKNVSQLTSCRDWLPTLIEYCELKIPRPTEFDGQSLSPLLDGNSNQWQSRTLFVERQSDEPTMGTEIRSRKKANYPHYAVLTEKWRLVDGELFDITNDPSQEHNIANLHPSVVAELKDQYRLHFEDVCANASQYARFQLGSPQENPTLLTVRDWHPTEGRVIWKQSQLGDDQLAINGFWAVNVIETGAYSIRLARFPEDAENPMRAVTARIQIGKIALEKTIAPNDTSVIFKTHLAAGPATLQTWLTDSEGTERGAYFVQIEKGVSTTKSK